MSSVGIDSGRLRNRSPLISNALDETAEAQMLIKLKAKN